MKIICSAEKLKKAIFNCERVVSKRNTLPILNNILFEAEKGSLKLSATNLEIGVSSKIGAKIEKEGKITIPARLISGFFSRISEDENINLEVKDDKMKIKNGSNKAIIRGILANDFPLIPNKKSEYLLEIPNLTFKKAFSMVISAAAINEARAELTGINLILGKKGLFWAATDSFRLAEYHLKLDEKNIKNPYYKEFSEKKESVIIPAITLIELNRIITPETGGMLKIAIEEGQVFFETDGVKLVSRLINGKYPEYKHIMPKDYKTRIVGEKTKLLGAVRLAGLFSSGAGKTGEVTLKIDSEAKKIFVEASSAETGENTTELKFDIMGPSQEIIFNSKYLLEGINTVSTDQIAILANNESTPVAIKEIDEKSGKILEDFTYIVMPIKN